MLGDRGNNLECYRVMGNRKNEKKEKEKRATAEAYPSNFGYLCDHFDNLRNICSLLSDA